MVPAEKYMSDDIIFEVFKDPLGLIMFPNGFSINNSHSTMIRATDLMGDFNNTVLSSINTNSINTSPNPLSLIRNIDEDEDMDLPNENYNEIDNIYNNLEREHSNIFDTFKAYNIPNYILKPFIKRIIKLTLQYHHRTLVKYFEDK